MHAAFERVPLERRPSALGHDVVLADRPGIVGVNQHEVGLHARTDEPAVRHAEQPGHTVGHQVRHFLNREDAVVHHVKHGHKRVLNQRTSGRRVEVAAILLFLGVGGVVGGNHIDAAVEDGGANLFPVLGRFHRGVPLDVGAFGLVIGIAEPQVVDARFRSDALVFERFGVVKQVQLTRRADVQDVQLGVELGGQLHGLGRAFVARLGTADQRVLCNGHRLAVTRPGRLGVGAHRGLIFTVCGHEGGRLLEDSFQHRGFVHEHVSRGGTHEDLDAADAGRVGFEHLVQIVVARPHEEAVVHGTHFRGSVVFVLEQVLGQSLRHRVGHLHERGDATGRRGRRLGRDLCLVSQARFSEVHLVVDASGHQPKPRAVLHFRACCQCLDVRVSALLRQVDADRHNVFPVHEDVLDSNGAVRDDVGVAKQGGLAHGRKGET